MLEVAIASFPEAVTSHFDGRAKAPFVEELSQLRALLRPQHHVRDGKATIVELAAQPVPVEPVNTVGESQVDGRVAHAL